MKRPPKSLLDPAFRYVDSYGTDLRKTFARVRREAREAKAKTPEPPPPANVAPIRKTTAR